MASINLAVNIELDTDLSEQELAQLTSALVLDFSRDSSKMLEKVLSDPILRGLPTGSVNIKALDEAEIAKAGATAALEAMAVACDDGAAKNDATAVERFEKASRPDSYTHLQVAAGVSGGLQAAAEYAREAITKL